MFYSFFALAARSPGRQRTFRRTILIHLLVLLGAACALQRMTGGVWDADRRDPAASEAAALLGNLLLIMGIVEGATLLGWRLTQMPKSQALEFLLVTPLRPARVFLAEAAVGLSRLALVTLAGLPVLTVLTLGKGCLNPADLLVLLLMPFSWGALTGLGLTAWAYEPLLARRCAETAMMLLVLVYLAIGVLAGEHLKEWLGWLPGSAERFILVSFIGFHRYNPFAIMHGWLNPPASAAHQSAVVGDFKLGIESWAWEQALIVEGIVLVLLVLLAARAAARLHGHFQDRHYRPLEAPGDRRRGRIGDRPLSWWAVRRVTEYSGRLNLWLAGGFGVLYALYTVASAADCWPSWLGRTVFVICDVGGGIPVLATMLVMLAAVPAAFQYGLWDSNAQDRCRRLELLLLTQLGSRDFWEASTAAAWRRGRGYFLAALVLWIAALVAPGVAAFHQVREQEQAVRIAAAVAVWSGSPQAGSPATPPWASLVLSPAQANAAPNPESDASGAWEAAWRASRARLLPVLAALAASIVLWGLYFTLSFRAFSRGLQANGLGTLLTLGLPLLAIVLFRSGWPALGALLPPGSVYLPVASAPSWMWLPGPLVAGLAMLILARQAQARCDAELRRWYDLHHGHKVLD